MTIDSVVKKLEHKDKVKIRMGIRPSGTPHIGTVNVINNCFLLAKAFMEKGQDASIDFTLADLLPTENCEYSGPLLKFDRFRFGEREAKSEYYGRIIKDYIQKVAEFMERHYDIEPKVHVHSDSQLEERKRYRKMLKSMIEILDSVSEKKNIFAAPYKYVICDGCKKAKPAEYEDGILFAHCKRHGDVLVDIINDIAPNITLHFILASVLRSTYFGSDVHVIGSEQKTHGFTDMMDKVTRDMGYEPPIIHTTAFFPKISKSLRPGSLNAYRERIGEYSSGALVLTSEYIDRRGWKTAQESTALKMMERFAVKLGYDPKGK